MSVVTGIEGASMVEPACPPLSRHRERVTSPPRTKMDVDTQPDLSPPIATPRESLPEWTLEESKHLVDLCSKLWCAFLVVEDRWKGLVAAGTVRTKTLEELKEHYYSLLPPSESEVKYDVEGDRERRDELRKLLQRPPGSDSKLAATVLGKRHVDQEYAALHEKEVVHLHMLRLFKEFSEMDELMRLPALPPPEEPASTPDIRILRGVAYLIPKPDLTQPVSKGGVVYLRSSEPLQNFDNISPQVVKMYQSEMDQLGFPKEKMPPLEVPTKLTCRLFDMIRTNVVNMVNLEALVALKETEVQQARAKLAFTKKKNSTMSSFKRRMSEANPAVVHQQQDQPEERTSKKRRTDSL